MAISPVDLTKSYRLLNHGPTTMISAQYNGIKNVMSASWVSIIEFDPARISVVIDRNTFTRTLIEQSGYFAVQIPVATQASLILEMGESYKINPNKLKDVELFYQPNFEIPLVANCAAWLICKLLPEPDNQQKYDLFIGEVVGAWADDRIFKNGHWHFDNAPDELRTLHYIAGGQFYTIGKGINLKNHPNAIG